MLINMTIRIGLLSLAIIGLSFFASIAVWAHSTTAVITMTAEGFEPPEVIVDTNTTVNFVNKDTVARWPASNLHPTHELYPEFDPKQVIEPGDFWLFKLTKTGTWRYHDHAYPHKRGTITVTPEAGEAQPPNYAALPNWRTGLQQSWTGFTNWLKSFFKPNRAVVLGATDFKALPEQEQYNYLQQLQKDRGAATAWEYVVKTYTSDTGSSLGGRSHDLAHLVGGLLYEEQGLKGLPVCAPTFAFGCFHGFTEAAFVNSLDQLAKVAAACASLGAANSGPWASCIHGIGHGVATYFDAQKLAEALATCDQLTSGATYCHDGVFMEFSFSAPPSFYKSGDPLYPCTTLDARYQAACARNQPQVMERRLAMTSPDIAAACLNVGGAIAQSCLDSVGFAIANESQGNSQIIIERCNQLSSPARSHCISAAAGELVFQNYPNWQNISPGLCATLPTADQPSCYGRVEQTAQNYGRK